MMDCHCTVAETLHPHVVYCMSPPFPCACCAVRLELLAWSPLHSTERPAGGSADPAADAGFDHMHWFATLFDYGMPADAAAADPTDPDAQLVPQLVAKIALPRVQRAVERCWEPSSSSQTRRLVAVMQARCARAGRAAPCSYAAGRRLVPSARGGAACEPRLPRRCGRL